MHGLCRDAMVDASARESARFCSLDWGSTLSEDFIQKAADALEMDLVWSGSGLDEVAFWRNAPVSRNSGPVVIVDSRYLGLQR